MNGNGRNHKVNPHIARERVLFRQWLRVVTLPEFAVLCMVFDRANGWNKRAERITLEQFETGVWSDTTCISGGTGLARHTILTAIESLTGDKYKDAKNRTPLVKEARSDRQIFYSINFDCMMPVPKRCKDGATIALGQCKPCTRNGATDALDMVQDLHPKNKKEEWRKKNKKEQCGSSAVAPASEVLDSISRKTVEKREQKASKGLNPGSKISDLNSLWKAEVLRGYPNIPVMPWTAEERGMVSTLRKKWEGAGNARASFGEFMQWSLRKWGAVLHFSYPNAARLNLPDKPKLRFWIRNAQAFIDRFHAGDVDAKAKETSRHAIAERERELEALAERTKREQAKVMKARGELEAVKRDHRLAERGLRAVEPSWKPDKVDMPDLDKLKHLYD